MIRSFKFLLTTMSGLILAYFLFVVAFSLGMGELRGGNLHHKVELLQAQETESLDTFWASALFLEHEIVSSQNSFYVIPDGEVDKLQAVKLTDLFSNVLLFSNLPLLLLLLLGAAVPFFINERNERRTKESLRNVNTQADRILTLLNVSLPEVEQQNSVSKLSLTLNEVYRNLTEQQRDNEVRIHQDKLTGLIDRHAYLEHLKEELEIAQQNKIKCGLLFIDLDGFKQVNDSFGHSFGDEILIQVAQRLSTVIRNHSLSKLNELTQLEMNLSRLGGDEFSIFIPNIIKDDMAASVARHVLKEVEQDFVLGNKLVKIGASIGIAVYPDSASNPNTLLQMADVAMYRAKTDGRGIFRVYSPEMGSKVRRYHYLLEEMRMALATNCFTLSFQPIVSVNDCTIDYFESLTRWSHPIEGFISPAEFIPIAEDSNLIIELGNWILLESCRQMSAWHNAGMNRVKVSVNISGVQLKHVSIYPWVMDTLKKSGLPPTALLLEVTESCFIDASEEVINGLNQLRAEGVCIAIDDFGTGFSSLSTLANLPVDVIKIDRLFIDQANVNPKYNKILSSISELGKQLELKVVAEGVESAAQFELVKKLGVHCVQGYLISQPEPSQKVGTKVFTNNTNSLAQMGTCVWSEQ